MDQQSPKSTIRSEPFQNELSLTIQIFFLFCKFLYVAQVLDTIYVGPISEGRHMFVFQADPPDVTKIPVEDALGVTVVLLTCSYRGQEFVRVGYFINNEYSDPELRENPPPTPQFDKVAEMLSWCPSKSNSFPHLRFSMMCFSFAQVTRNILGTEPRVTRFKINWDDSEGAEDGCASTDNGTGPTIESTNALSSCSVDGSGSITASFGLTATATNGSAHQQNSQQSTPMEVA